MERHIYVHSIDRARYVMLSPEQAQARKKAHKDAVRARLKAHEKYGISREFWGHLVDMGAVRAYERQKRGAARRGIAWEFNISEWWTVWEESGRWTERGCLKGQYVMARTGDVGPYAPWNVRIATTDENLAESQTTRLLKRAVTN